MHVYTESRKMIIHTSSSNRRRIIYLICSVVQANIGVVDPHLAAPPPPPPSLESKPAASMSNAGRFVTLPPRSGNTSVQILPNSPKRDAMIVDPPPMEAVATATRSVTDETSILNEQNGLNTQNHVS